MAKRRDADYFASFAPKEHREYVRQEVAKTEAAKAEFEKKRPQAATMQSLEGDTGDDLAMHDAAVRAAAAERERNKAAARAKREREQARSKGGSRRRRRADAWAERGRKLHKRMVDHQAKYAAKLRQFGQHDAAPIPVTPLVWGVTQAIMSDPTGHNARIKLASLPPIEARRIMRAALMPRPYQPKRQREGRTLRKVTKLHLHGPAKWWVRPGLRRWCHPMAIRTIALGVGLWHLRRRTSRRGFSSVVRGMPRRMMCAIATDALSGERPCINTLYGNLAEVPGAVRALEAAGALQCRQPPGAKVSACDRGPSGYAFNVYWWFRPGREAREPLDDEEAEVSAMRESLRTDLGLGRAPPEAA